MDAKERLRKARNFLQLSQEALAMATGSQRTTVAGYESGVSLPRAEFLKELSIKYGINPNWILTGQGEMLNTTTKNPPIIEELQKIITQTVEPLETRLTALESLIERDKPAPVPAADGGGPLYLAEPAPAYGEEEDYGDAPYVHDMAAGPPIWIDEDRSQTVSVPLRLMRKGGRYYAATVRGASMTGAGIRDGDMILVRYTDVPKDGAVQVVRYQDKVTLKRLRETEGGGWELRYMDGSGRAVACNTDEYEVLGEFEEILPKNTVPRDR